MIPAHPCHLKAFDYVGFHRYFLTFCTDFRRPVFSQAEAVSVVLEQLLRSSREQNFAVIAYCFMPDHVHLLIEATAEHADCKRFIAAFKQYSGYYYRQRFGSKLWQRYGYERVLRNDESTVEVAKYVLANPVRAGLSATVREYPYVGSLVCELKDLVDSTR